MELSDKTCIYFTYVDIYYWLHQFARTHQIIINLIHVLVCVNFIYMPWSCRTFKPISSPLSVWPRGLRCQFSVRKAASSNLTENIYFHFEFFACFPFLTTGRSPYRWNQTWNASRVKGAKIDMIYKRWRWFILLYECHTCNFKIAQYVTVS